MPSIPNHIWNLNIFSIFYVIYIKSNKVPTLPNSSHGLCQVYSKVQTLVSHQKHVMVLHKIECEVLWTVKINSKGCIRYNIKFNELFKIGQRHTLGITIIHVNFSNQIRGHIRYNIWFNIGGGGGGRGGVTKILVKSGHGNIVRKKT